MATLLELLKQQQQHEEEEDFEEYIPPMKAIRLVSNDGYEFVIDKETAMISLTIRNMIYGGANFEEVETKIVRLPIRALILEKIIEYWHYRSQYSDNLEQLPKFEIDPAMAIDLLQGSEYLQT
ncbi:Skp1 family, tetramerization domain containing protein [Tritrichomonas foetus]|uniref:Elongin-C n=1 Tax=Tritrichomonas foetus TaxID=1144522 RepID=A0A1J4J7Q2_9EUKA|nr:Skp1 family, tetramerization domain containing protein [Tritrichomonas foetus]|eukprot:OHS94255.1 Skp1 family, tetramerization domain containing protein [Tritrichomonas foetus]